jgi:hypothetical protein
MRGVRGGSDPSWYQLGASPTAKHDQLLTQESVFGDEFSPGAGKIVEHPPEVRVTGRPRPLHQTLPDLTKAALEQTHQEAEQTRHRDKAP